MSTTSARVVVVTMERVVIVTKHQDISLKAIYGLRKQEKVLFGGGKRFCDEGKKCKCSKGGTIVARSSVRSQSSRRGLEATQAFDCS